MFKLRNSNKFKIILKLQKRTNKFKFKLRDNFMLIKNSNNKKLIIKIYYIIV